MNHPVAARLALGAALAVLAPAHGAPPAEHLADAKADRAGGHPANAILALHRDHRGSIAWAARLASNAPETDPGKTYAERFLAKDRPTVASAFVPGWIARARPRAASPGAATVAARVALRGWARTARRHNEVDRHQLRSLLADDGADVAVRVLGVHAIDDEAVLVRFVGAGCRAAAREPEAGRRTACTRWSEAADADPVRRLAILTGVEAAERLRRLGAVALADTRSDGAGTASPETHASQIAQAMRAPSTGERDAR